MKKILGKQFFEDKNTIRVAKKLLGKFLVRRIGKHTYAYMITEVEAYHGPHDKASHAHRGKTLRNASMFGESGYWYVYFVYGMHWMLNMVTGPKDYPAAVLIRGLNLETGRPNGRPVSKFKNIRYPLGYRMSKLVISGPGKLTHMLGISKRFNNKQASKSTGLWVEDRGIKIPRHAVHTAPRVGVSYAQEWAEKPYRFYFKI